MFEWDEAKSKRNLLERGFDFDYAAAIFADLTLERPDQRRDYDESRIQAIGRVGEDILFVAYTDRGDVRRIISARRATRKERMLWESFAARWQASGA